MARDQLDKVIAEWRDARPDLDAEGLAVVGRVLRLAGHLERRTATTLKPFGLAIWSFDVLGALRRHGKPYAMTPSELMRAVMLSSGAMTNRIDRLEKMGLVERKPDPQDRRSLKVGLTTKGVRLIDKAVGPRLAEAKDAIGTLVRVDRQRMVGLLRTLLLSLEDQP